MVIMFMKTNFRKNSENNKNQFEKQERKDLTKSQNYLQTKF